MAIKVAELLIAVKADVNAAISSMDSVSKKLEGMGKGALKFGGLLSVGFTLPLILAGREALKSVASYEMLGLSLQSLVAAELAAAGEFATVGDAMGAAGVKAKELQSWIEKLAIESPFTQAGVAAAFQTGMAYGFTTDQSKRLSQAMIDFAAGAGRGETVMNQIALALGQIQAKGKLAGQEVLQLTNAGLNVRKILADAFGVSTAKIVEMQEQGLIPAGKAIEAIVTSLETNFGGAAKRTSTTLTGLIASLQDIKEISLRDIFGGAFEAAKPALQDLVDTLTSGAFRASLQNIGLLMGQAFTKVIPAIQWLIGGISKVVSWFSALNPKVLQAGVSFGLVLAAAGPLMLAFSGIAALLGGLIVPIGIIIVGLGILAGAFVLFGDKIKEIVGGFVDNFGILVKVFLDGLPGMANAALDTIVGFLNSMLEKVEDAVNWAIRMLNKIPGVNLSPVEWTPIDPVKLKANISEALSYTKSTLGAAGVGVGNLFDALTDQLNKAIKKPDMSLLDEMGDLRPRAADVGADIGETFGVSFDTGAADVIGSSSSSVNKAFESFKSKIGSFLSKGMGFSKGLFDVTGGDTFSPGANGPFEDLFRAGAVAAGGESDQWASVLGLTQADAIRITKDFQRGLFTPEVIGLINVDALIGEVQAADAAEKSQAAFIESIASKAGVKSGVVYEAMGLADPNAGAELGQQLATSFTAGTLENLGGADMIGGVVTSVNAAITERDKDIRAAGEAFMGALVGGAKDATTGIGETLINILLPGLIAAIDWRQYRTGGATP